QRVDEGARLPVPAEHEADGYGGEDSERHAEEDALRGHPDILRQALAGELPEARGDGVRRGHERGIDEAAVVDRVPERQYDKPRGDDEDCVPHDAKGTIDRTIDTRYCGAC